jgi:hypothetical protein
LYTCCSSPECPFHREDTNLLRTSGLLEHSTRHDTSDEHYWEFAKPADWTPKEWVHLLDTASDRHAGSPLITELRAALEPFSGRAYRRWDEGGVRIAFESFTNIERFLNAALDFDKDRAMYRRAERNGDGEIPDWIYDPGVWDKALENEACLIDCQGRFEDDENFDHDHHGWEEFEENDYNTNGGRPDFQIDLDVWIPGCDVPTVLARLRAAPGAVLATVGSPEQEEAAMAEFGIPADGWPVAPIADAIVGHLTSIGRIVAWAEESDDQAALEQGVSQLRRLCVLLTAWAIAKRGDPEVQ